MIYKTNIILRYFDDRTKRCYRSQNYKKQTAYFQVLYELIPSVGLSFLPQKQILTNTIMNILLVQKIKTMYCNVDFRISMD